MGAIKKIGEILKWLESVSFRFKPKSSEPFDKGLLLAKFFEGLSNTDRSSVLKRLQANTANKLLPLSAFMAEKAIDTSDSSWIRAAVILHIIEDFRKDYRENIRYLVLIAYAAKEIKVDFHQIVSSVLSLASVRTHGHMNDFLARDDELNKLESFGIKAVKVNNKSRFVPV